MTAVYVKSCSFFDRSAAAKAFYFFYAFFGLCLHVSVLYAAFGQFSGSCQNYLGYKALLEYDYNKLRMCSWWAGQ